MFHIVLVEPEIPANTGSIGRSCVATHTPLHLIRPLGFSLEDKYLKRAGLDYWKHVDLRIYDSWKDFQQQNPSPRKILFSKKATQSFFDFGFQPGDYLIFGKETQGLPDLLLNKEPSSFCRETARCKAAGQESERGDPFWVIERVNARPTPQVAVSRQKLPNLRIPTPGPVRSLNLAVAASVALYEALRQTGSLSNGQFADKCPVARRPGK